MSVVTPNSSFDFKSYVSLRRQLVEERLKTYLQGDDPAVLWASMRYSVLSGGKRLRALLCLASGEAVSGSDEIIDLVMPCACAIELVHAMSLIHDDLPCLDNDDMRRGKPTNHKVFGEAMALLAGDALLIMANEILIDRTPGKVDPSTLLSVSLELSKCLGSSGMVGGQVDDMKLTGAFGSEEAGLVEQSEATQLIESVHLKKTAALIRFSLWSGAKIAGCKETVLLKLSRLGDIMGLAFQIADDLLDVTGDAFTLGKTPGKDEAAKKTTWVRIFGEDGARERLLKLEEEGRKLLAESNFDGGSAPALHALLGYAIHRIN